MTSGDISCIPSKVGQIAENIIINLLSKKPYVMQEQFFNKLLEDEGINKLIN